MMDAYVYGRPIKETQDILLASAIYVEVINGLNGYFESEGANDYITICSQIDNRKFFLYDPEKWADILISWLRTKHEIFYYPGMEAKYAKGEKIRPFSERKMDEGALNSLKKLNKIVTGEEAGTNSHTLIADGIRYAVNAKESEIKKLKGRITELESNFKVVCDEDDIFRARALKAEEEVQKLKVELNTLKDTVSKTRNRLNKKFCALGYEDDIEKLADIALRAVEARDETIDRITRPWYDECEDAKKEAKQECYKYLWNELKNLSPDCDALKITDYEKLVDRIFYEMSLVEDGCKQCRRKQSTEKFDYIQRTNKAEEEVKKLKEQLDKATADYQALSEENQELKDNQKSDINKLIRDYCTKNGIIAPSRYLSDEACVEYLFKYLFSVNENLRGQIKRLKDLINAMNEEVKDM